MDDVVERIVVITISESWSRHGRDASRIEGRTYAAAEGYLASVGFGRVGIGDWARSNEFGSFRARITVESC